VLGIIHYCRLGGDLLRVGGVCVTSDEGGSGSLVNKAVCSSVCVNEYACVLSWF